MGKYQNGWAKYRQPRLNFEARVLAVDERPCKFMVLLPAPVHDTRIGSLILDMRELGRERKYLRKMQALVGTGHISVSKGKKMNPLFL